jgi:dihydropteroate synthase
MWQTGLGPVSLGSPLYLGILNLTPDSFSDGGRFQEPGAAVARAHALVAQGAGALDLGAESTRPGAAPVSPETEWARLEPVLGALRAQLGHIPLSLDTRHALVAARGLLAGAAVINDVTGFRDPAMLAAVRRQDCGLIAMRSLLDGDDLVMPAYHLPAAHQPETAIRELAQVRDRLLAAGIAPERILLDPGFGFGLSYAGDLALWDALPGLPEALHWPVEQFCIGISRKRFLARRAGTPDLPAGQRDALTAEAHRQAFDLGYRVFRTHASGRQEWDNGA